MPQMAPLMWINIMVTGLVIVFLLTLITYFKKSNNLDQSSNFVKKQNSKQWLW